MTNHNKYRPIFLIIFVLIMLLLPACNRSEQIDPTAERVISPIPTILSSESHVNSPVKTPSLPASTVNTIPTPSPEHSTITGVIVDGKGVPMSGMAVYLGIYDGTLIEVSLKNSPRTITDASGRFILTDIQPNEEDTKYAIGIIMGADSGKIINKPGTGNTLTFNANAGDIVDLGVLPVDF